MKDKAILSVIIEILRKEGIRLIDGRWSGGFVDTDELDHLIDEGIIEIYKPDNGVLTFVRLKKAEPQESEER